MTDTAAPEPWIVTPRRRADARMRLVCLPYCGGSPSIYSGWAQRLPDDLDAWLVQLPGRGSRFRERPYLAMPPLVDNLASALQPALTTPYALFGHSLGALIAFELARELRRRQCAPPVRLFASACGAPHTPDPFPGIHALPDAEFLDEIVRLKGTPAEVLAEPELMRALLPTLRADFSVYETYTYAEDQPLSCPLTVLGGTTDDRVSRDRLDAWDRHTTGGTSLTMLPGGHFFLHTQREALLPIITSALAPAARAAHPL